MSIQPAAGDALHGLRVLVVGDDYFIASETCTESLADAVRLEKPIDLAALLHAVESTCPSTSIDGPRRMW